MLFGSKILHQTDEENVGYKMLEFLVLGFSVWSFKSRSLGEGPRLRIVFFTVYG